MAVLESYERYAVYYAPEAESPLARLGAAWLGRDARTGAALAPPAVQGLPVARELIVGSPARYGLHATIRAPFRLVDGATLEALDAAVAAFAEAAAPAEADGLAVANHHGFLALTPVGAQAALAGLAQAAVEAFEPFRAPLRPEDRARRLASGLDPREVALLDRWGYPFVDDRFQFHITLSERLEAAQAEAARAALAPLFDAAAPKPFRLDRLCIFGDPGGGAPFRLLSEHRLLG